MTGSDQLKKLPNDSQPEPVIDNERAGNAGDKPSFATRRGKTALKSTWLRAVILSVACGGCNAGGQEPAATPVDGLDAPAAGEGIQLGITAHVEAGEEITICRYVNPAGAAPAGLDVQRFEHRFTGGSHHLVLFSTSTAVADVTTWDAFDCSDGAAGRSGIMYAAQSPEGQLEWPQGVASHIPAETASLIEWHIVNSQAAAADVEAAVNLHFAKPPITAEASTLYYYDYFISVPAHGMYTARMRCEVPSDFSMTWAMSHMHKQGYGFRSWLLDTNGNRLRELYQSADWDHPTPTAFDPPLEVKSGQVIEYECDFQNDGATPVIEGPSAVHNEMCMLVGGYFPKFQTAQAERCTAGNSGPIFDGDQTCMQSYDCIRAAEDPALAQHENPAREACWTATNAAGGIPLTNLLLKCRLTACVAACPAGLLDDPMCQTCIETSCAAELAACQAASQ